MFIDYKPGNHIRRRNQVNLFITHDNSSQICLTKNTLIIEPILTARQNCVLWEAEAITMADTGIYDDRTDFHGAYVAS